MISCKRCAKKVCDHRIGTTFSWVMKWVSINKRGCQIGLQRQRIRICQVTNRQLSKVSNSVSSKHLRARPVWQRPMQLKNWNRDIVSKTLWWALVLGKTEMWLAVSVAKATRRSLSSTITWSRIRISLRHPRRSMMHMMIRFHTKVC